MTFLLGEYERLCTEILSQNGGVCVSKKDFRMGFAVGFCVIGAVAAVLLLIFLL